jgi:D-alanyl-D-alanine endopeptidase (penicillin-binding protein 7)
MTYRFAWAVLVTAGMALMSGPAQARAAEQGTTAGKAGKARSGATAARRAPAVAARSHPAASHRVTKRGGRLVKVAYAPRAVEPARPSIGQAIGLHSVDDPLDLRSSVALVVDQRSGEVMYEKNPTAVLPIASITKLMTAMVVLDSHAPLQDTVEVTEADIDTERFSRSRLRPGSRLMRAEMLQLALMASENRAASALGRNHPGGLATFVAAMNAKARSLGMDDSAFVEPTGLSSSNVSSARDLARMVRAAADYPAIREYSTANELTVDTGFRQVAFRNTNRLIDSPSWDIGVSKTGYISEAGNCLVMQVRIEGRPVIMVLLDAIGRQSRFADAQRLRQWLESSPIKASAPARPMRVSARTLGS